MKIVLIILILMACVAGCVSVARQGKMKKWARALICVAICAVCVAAELSLAAALVLEKNKIILRADYIGTPYAEIYTEEQISSRLSADMMIHGGKLYVGGGDYDKNTGPVYVMSYDLARGVWEKSAEALPDEQIKRFELIGGELAILGTDPRGDWSFGNYYVLRDGAWETLRVLPSGIHCFDYVEFEGEGFFGLGVNSGDYPVVRFDGEAYTSVEFRKNGEALDTSACETVRVYNLFVHGGELYAFLTFDSTDGNGEKHYLMELYRYSDGKFEYVFGTLPSTDMPEIISHGDRTFFIMGGMLLTSASLESFDRVALGEGVRAVDMIKSDGAVYVLAARQISEGYCESMVFESSDGVEFSKLFGFLSHSSAGAFCKDGGNFYFSLGEYGNVTSHADAGRAVAVRYER